MIQKVYTNGQVSTFLVFGNLANEPSFNPILEALKEQAERIESLEEQNRELVENNPSFKPILEALKELAKRIESLEEQNRELVRQEKLLEFLEEVTTQTGELMSRGLKAIELLGSRVRRR